MSGSLRKDYEMLLYFTLEIVLKMVKKYMPIEKFKFLNISYGNTTTYIVGCRDVVQLGGLVPGYPWEVSLRLMLVSLFYSLNVPLKLKIKNTWLILLSH